MRANPRNRMKWSVRRGGVPAGNRADHTTEGGAVTTTTNGKRLKLPAGGPGDPAVYLTLLALMDCPEGCPDPDDPDTLWACDPVKRERFRLDLRVVDRLISLGWVDDSQGYDVLALTERGRWWVSKFVRQNGGEL